MNQFKVFRHPIDKSIDGFQAVKQGWCWPAFFFSFIWASKEKMWGLGLGFFLACLILVVIWSFGVISDALISIICIIINIVFGVNGNGWIEKNLISRGFELKDTVKAGSKNGALIKFMLDPREFEKTAETIRRIIRENQ